MKELKKSISVVLALIMVLSVFVVAPTVTNASGSWIQMVNFWGTLHDYGDSAYKEFTLSKKAQVKFVMGSSYSSGSYKFNIENDYGEFVMEKEGYISSSDHDQVYTTTLAAGTYYINMYNNDESGEEALEYDFYAYRFYNPPKNPTKLKLNRTKISLCKGGEYTLKAKYSPSDVTSKVKFTSSNKSIASVSTSGEYGYVKGKRFGIVTITAKMGTKKAKCKVVVCRDTIQMPCGKSKNMVSYVKKVKGYKKAKWTTSKKSVITVTKKGKIKLKKHGIATISAKIKGKKYKVKIYSVSKSGVKKRTLDLLKERLYVPQSLKVEKVVYPAYNGVKIYYKAKNTWGEWRYNAITGYLWYDILYYKFDS